MDRSLMQYREPTFEDALDATRAAVRKSTYAAAMANDPRVPRDTVLRLVEDAQAACLLARLSCELLAESKAG